MYVNWGMCYPQGMDIGKESVQIEVRMTRFRSIAVVLSQLNLLSVILEFLN